MFRVFPALQHFNGLHQGDGGGGGGDVRAVAFLPQRFIESRHEDNLADDVETLQELRRKGWVHVTPAGVDDDRFILKWARLKNCKIVSNDNFADHIRYAPKPAELRGWLARQCLKYMFVGDEFLPL